VCQRFGRPDAYHHRHIGYDDDWLDEDTEQVAYHEAGHAVAAVLCAVGWTEARLFDDDSMESHEMGLAGRTKYVAEHYYDTTPANQAFIAWAGSWAQARYLSPDDPWRDLAGLHDTTSAGDMEDVYAYWNDPANAPLQSDEQWAREMDWAWPAVVPLAERLMRRRVVRTPLHPDWEG
jgi:hypothetical protein